MDPSIARHRSDRPLPALTPALRRSLWLIGLCAGLLALNSLYLVAVTLVEQLSGRTLQNLFYLDMFLVHLGLGLLLLIPTLTFALLHARRAIRRPNRYAIRAGLGLGLALIALFGSGILLTRFGFFEVNDPSIRRAAYWVHLLAPLAVIWLFTLHRLAGPPLRWQIGAAWAGAAATFTLVALAFHLAAAQSPEDHREAIITSSADTQDQRALKRSFAPALASIPGTDRIPAEHLMDDAVCAECHSEIAARHAGSMHRFSSFNNPAYRKVVEDSRAEFLARDGTHRASRLCAVCHDPVPLFSGRFDEPDFDPDTDPTAKAGISCLSCHAITAVGSPRGNGDYRLVDPPRYPFAFSEQPLLRAINRQLIKAKPAFHQQTLLKPVHREPEFCGACHKVHLPVALNQYRWLRGQNHYDSFRLSGVSGHRVDSFYYPHQAEASCNGCHMPARAADDPAARLRTADGQPAVHDHLFAAANRAVADWVERPADENAERIEMMRRAARVDLFGIKERDQLQAPLGLVKPTLKSGRRYLLEVVVRTQGIGHALTQGTADSNEVWLELKALLEGPDGERLIGQSGALDSRGAVDDWAWFGNAYLLDRHGERISRRNAQDIVVPLYDHQIPPGATALVHYALEIPADASSGSVRIEAALRYRKFDSRFMHYLLGDAFSGNKLPITTLARDQVRLALGPVPAGAEVAELKDSSTVSREDSGAQPQDGITRQSETAAASNEANPQPLIPAWERWNDYGIGLLRQGKRGESRQAEAAFRQVEALGSANGPLNLARVLYREGRLEEAAAALARAAEQDYPQGEAPPWVIAWYTALIARDLGDLDRAIAALAALAETRFSVARERGFDFAVDDRMLVEFGRTLYERARQERGETNRDARLGFLDRARSRLDQALALDPENAAAHHNLSLVLAELGETEAAAVHRRLHERYRPDDNAVERVVSLHRSRNPAADHAAEPVAIYALGLPDQ
ncbi:MAG: aspartate phosphatase [Halochromatium sp.]|nr:aspartate phosphatase [Halochromatium sp.]